MTDQLLDHLNPQQREAVTTTDGPLLVIAGAGSGKTRVITHRIAYLIERCGVQPWQIFAATFTNKAAEEMGHRINALVPGADTAQLTISTFHSICVGILRQEAPLIGLSSRFTICDDGDQRALIKDCLRNLDAVNVVKPEQVRSYITAAKIQMLSPKQAQDELSLDWGEVCNNVYEQYQQRLLTNNAVDFDDLLLHVVRIFQDHPDVLDRYQERWRYLMVDEYQDTNRVQFELIRLLAEKYGNLCVVGDEDQSIYSWRGAEIENLLEFPNIFEGTRVIPLEQNYRSTETILSASNAVITHNRQRNEKNLWSENGRGEPITMITGFNEREEAARVVDTMRWLRRKMGRPYREMAIFYRVNALSRVFEDQLRQADIPYRVIGGIKFYDRAEVKDMLAYLRLVVNPRDSMAVGRVLNKPTRGIGAKSQAALYNEAVARRVSVWDILQKVKTRAEDAPKVSPKARAGITDFVVHIEQWREWSTNRTPHELLERILTDIHYEEAQGSEKNLDAIARRENIAELASALEDYHKQQPGSTLDEFLERVALVNAQDGLDERDAVSLMTLHCAKGLEYDVVFMVGMEDPLFPSQRAVQEQGHYEEERRLFYVGITRARQLLFLSRADGRLLHGRPNYNTPSLFLREVPGELMRTLEDARRHWFDLLSERAHEAPIAAEPGEAFSVTPEPVIASAADDGEGLFPIGSRVAHERLGEGLVVDVAGAGERRKVTVQFDAGLRLEILEQYGGLAAVAEGDLPY